MLGTDSLRALADLCGHRWLLFGGAGLAQGMGDVAILLVTDGPAVTVSGAVEYLEFEGLEDTYSYLGIDRGAAELDAARSAGRVYHYAQGQEVCEILVVRQTVQAFHGGDHLWTYESDLAVVVRLEAGVVAVAKMSQHAELLTVVTAPSVAELQIAEPSSSWRETPDMRYDLTCRTVPVASLLVE